MSKNQETFQRGLSIIAFVLAITYGIGLMAAIGGWLGHQNLDETLWSPATFPYFSIIFALGFVSALGVLNRRRWGVFGLAITWVTTGLANLIAGPPFPAYALTVFGVLLVLVFFLFLLPVWPEMD